MKLSKTEWGVLLFFVVLVLWLAYDTYQSHTKPAFVFDEGTTQQGTRCAFLTSRDKSYAAMDCDFTNTKEKAIVEAPAAQ